MEIDQNLIATLKRAKKITILTGAGISAESNIPTFRDVQTGFWANYRPEDLATPEAFHKNPRLVWEWYSWRRTLVQNANPNPGHYALAKMADLVPKLTLLTQNVDNLHQRAGSPNVIELHGNIFQAKCYQENMRIESWDETGEIPPRCPGCGGYLRPDVVWFGENLPADALKIAWQASAECDIFFSIGTSSIVQPSASLAHLAIKHKAVVVEININPTPLSASATYTLQGLSGSILPLLIKKAWNADL